MNIEPKKQDHCEENEDEDENTPAKSIVDEIIEETEKDEPHTEHVDSTLA